MSNPKFEKGIFIFHRDLRLNDNTGFLDACSQCAKLYTIFIFTPEQITSRNKYRSENAIQFMIESLNDLHDKIKEKGGELAFFYGKSEEILEKIIERVNINAVFFNRDFTPFAIEREKKYTKKCDLLGIECVVGKNDYYLFEPGQIKNGTGIAYRKFTPFYNHVLSIVVEKPDKRLAKHLVKMPNFSENIDLADIFPKIVGKPVNTQILVKGGRKEGILGLNRALQTQSHYDETRDFFENKTSLLSAHLKFGTVSIREVYYAFYSKYGKNSEFIRQLIWRDFFSHLLFAFPDSLTDLYGPFKWSMSQLHLTAWKKGQTGFPIVDAAMRELNQTGYMHNRGRMTVAHFLVKILLIDWKLGEQYFAQKLTDYDPASNSGNWASIFGRGMYISPYFRVMSPWIQSAKFDKNCVYIKKWIPELSEVKNIDIHHWNDSYKKYPNTQYEKPIVDYNEQKEIFIRLFREP